MSLVFGTGSARCGTKSLATLFGEQSHVAITHERFIIPWEFNEKECARVVRHCQVKPMRQAITRGKPVRWVRYDVSGAQIMGDIAPYYLNYAQRLIEEHDAKIVCLKRDKEATVKSFLKQRFDHCSRASDRDTKPPRNLYISLPKFDKPTRRENAEAYWDYFYALAEEIEGLYPEHFRIWEMESLNYDVDQREILTFIGVPLNTQTNVSVDPRYTRYSCRLNGGNGGDG